MLSVADDSLGRPLTCPKCRVRIDMPSQKANAEVNEGLRPGHHPPDVGPGWLGKRVQSVRPLVFGFLLPIVTVALIVSIILSYGNGALGMMRGNADRAIGFVCFFFFLDVVVIAQIGYWMLWNKSAGNDALNAAKQTTNRVGLFVAVALAVVIFLCATCLVLGSPPEQQVILAK
jgi:hypothetical protein